jgi:hypothetical protein
MSSYSIRFCSNGSYATRQRMPTDLATYACTHKYDTHTYVLQPDTQAIYLACNLCLPTYAWQPMLAPATYARTYLYLYMTF